MSSKLFREVNEDDARASVKTYVQHVAASRGFIADPNPIIFNGADELTGLLKSGAVDFLSMPTQEFLELGENLVTGPILVSRINGSDTEEYVLLVRADSGINTLSDLKGRKLLVLDSGLGCLAWTWLEVLLGKQGLGSPEKFFHTVARPVKVSQAVLPVFFQQAAACIVTRQGFDLMGELNPQVTNQLRVLAVSPTLVPYVACFRSGFDRSLKAEVAAAVSEVNGTTAGKQLMTMFQCDGVEERPLSILQSARDLLAARARLHGDAGALQPVAVTPSPTSQDGGDR